MKAGYQWDVFLSYPRADPVGPWVRDYFFPLLSRWLGASTPHEPTVFFDSTMEGGVHWPSRLKNSLLRSRCLVAIWSPHFFRSRWCLAEWQSMRAREELLRIGRGERPGLVCPVLFADGDCFPKEARETQHARDLRPYNIVNPAFRRTAKHGRLEREVQILCDQLSSMIQAAPEWSPDWPVAEPEPEPEIRQSLPRLR